MYQLQHSRPPANRLDADGPWETISEGTAKQVANDYAGRFYQEKISGRWRIVRVWPLDFDVAAFLRECGE